MVLSIGECLAEGQVVLASLLWTDSKPRSKSCRNFHINSPLPPTDAFFPAAITAREDDHHFSFLLCPILLDLFVVRKQHLVVSRRLPILSLSSQLQCPSTSHSFRRQRQAD